MKNKKSNVVNVKFFVPESPHDFEDIVEILQERESSVIVDMSKYNIKTEVMKKIINFILSCQTYYAVIRVKKIFSKVFVCWSEHID